MSDNNMYMVTHSEPDLDAIVSVWLLRCSVPLLGATELLFVPKYAKPFSYSTALAVCDVGKQYDPDTLRFDHKPTAAFPMQSAATLVLRYLKANELLHQQPRLDNLVYMVMLADHHRTSKGVVWSRRLGPHAELDRARRTYRSGQRQAIDQQVYGHMAAYLSELYGYPPG